MKYFKLPTVILALVCLVIGATALIVNRLKKEAFTNFEVHPPSFLYNVLNKDDLTGEIRLFEIPANFDHPVYSFSLLSADKTPTFSLRSNTSLVLDIETPKQYLIDIPKKAATTIKKTDVSLPFLLSPSGSFRAYNQNVPGSDEKESTKLIIQSNDGSWRAIPSGSVGDFGTGMLVPLHWTSDEQILYAQRVQATEGDLVGLYAIDVSTLEVSRISMIDDLNISRYVFDAQSNVYGFQPFNRLRPEDSAQTKFFRVSLTTGEKTEFVLHRSALDDLFTIDPAGRYLIYADGSDFNTRDVWLYDISTGAERPITENTTVNDLLRWNEGKIVFLEENLAVPTSTSLVVYDVLKNSRQVVAGDTNSMIQLIGWYNAP